MKKVGFIGVYDKIDLILYVAKILTTLGKKVLIVDSTLNQKARYIVPTINPTLKYVTEFEEIDIAVGFENLEEIILYLGIQNENELEYDIILFDVDNCQKICEYNLKQAPKNYFVTSFDAYSLKKGVEILSQLKEPFSLTKILFAEEILKEEDDYLNYLALGYKVVWNEYRIYFPIENGDLTVIHENQRVAKIKFKKLSFQYKDSLAYIAGEILDETSDTQIRNAIKSIEKGV